MLKHIWLPCSQMKDYETFKPIHVTKAYSSYIETIEGHRIIDAISSWWCKSLGHNHPRLKEALITQMEKFEHVIQADTVNDTIILLSEKLSNLTSSLKKVLYAGDGSTVVEIAIKMSLHAQKHRGNSKRTKFITLKNGYHGETIGAMSVSDIGRFKAPYNDILFNHYFIPFIPYVNGITDPLWNDCSEYWTAIEIFLQEYSDTACAIMLEPIVQGASGMRIYSQDFLKRLRKWTKENDVYLIADEIMTGIGRTGKMLACEYANIEPDFLCLSKGLTAGWVPFSAVLTSDDVYKLFYDDYNKGKSFLHSNTYCGNVLAASIALEVLKIIEEENLSERANMIGNIMRKMMQDIANSTQKLNNVRGIGAIVAADLIDNKLNSRLGYEIYKKAVSLGALLRPLGNTIYWFPPLNINIDTLEELKKITYFAILGNK